jgi:hypothetical protein
MGARNDALQEAVDELTRSLEHNSAMTKGAVDELNEHLKELQEQKQVREKVHAHGSHMSSQRRARPPPLHAVRSAYSW